MNEKRKRGFALWDPARHREVASVAGKAGHAQKTAHEWTSDEAAAAGRKGGLKTACKRWGHVFGPDAGARCTRCDAEQS
jgi:hypothetical protein